MGRDRFCAIEQISFADEITCVVEEFAIGSDLAFDSYYHDLPIWIVHERPSQNRIRRLQATAYLVNNAPYLSLVPSIHLCVDARKLLVPKLVQPERFPILQILDEQGGFRRDMLIEKLCAVWEKTATLNFAREQLMEIELAAPVPIQTKRVAGHAVGHQGG
jgi:hypothetical protein